MQPRCERRDVLIDPLGTPMRIEQLITTFVVGSRPSGRDGIMAAIMPRDQGRGRSVFEMYASPSEHTTNRPTSKCYVLGEAHIGVPEFTTTTAPEDATEVTLWVVFCTAAW